MIVRSLIFLTMVKANFNPVDLLTVVLQNKKGNLIWDTEATANEPMQSVDLLLFKSGFGSITGYAAPFIPNRLCFFSKNVIFFLPNFI